MSRSIRLAYPALTFKEVMQPLRKVIDSGLLTKGPKTREFEKIASKYLRVKHAIAVSSGTAALHLSLLSLNIAPGDEVIVPNFTFPATSNMVEFCGAKAVLVDIDPKTLNIDSKKILKNINRRTRAIMPVHQFGNPVEMNDILKIAKKYKLYVIEDAACAIGSKYRNMMCGTIGDIGCFSFHPRKIITTGEGGLVVTNDSRLAAKCRSLREHGMESCGKERVFNGLGLNYRISEIASVLGINQINKLEKIIKKRIYLAGQFKELLKPIKAISVIPQCVEKGSRCNYQSFVAIINKNIELFKLISFLKKKGIEASVSNIILNKQPYYLKKYRLKDSDFKNSLWIYKHAVALPFHCNMKKNDFIYIASNLKYYLEK